MPKNARAAAPDVAQFRTYEALLENLKAYARWLRDTSNGPKSVQHAQGRALLAWARLYDVAGPRPIEPAYPTVTAENAREIDAQMKAYRAVRAAWDAKTSDALDDAFAEDAE